jgi:hypothetical protein
MSGYYRVNQKRKEIKGIISLEYSFFMVVYVIIILVVFENFVPMKLHEQFFSPDTAMVGSSHAEGCRSA